MSDSLPADLIAAQRELHAARHERAAFLAALPKWAELSTTPEATSWKPGDPPAGWSAEQAAQEAELRERERQLAHRVHAHPHWATLEGGALVEARSKLLPAAARERE